MTWKLASHAGERAVQIEKGTSSKLWLEDPLRRGDAC